MNATTIKVAERTMSDSRTLEIGARFVAGSIAGPAAWIDGVERLASPVRRLATPVEQDGRTYTHSLGKIAVTDLELEAVRAAVRRLEVGAGPDLAAERAALTDDLAAALDEVERGRERAMAEDAARAIPSYEADPAVIAARAALDRFDVEHPEVIATRGRERAEAARRLADN